MDSLTSQRERRPQTSDRTTTGAEDAAGPAPAYPVGHLIADSQEHQHVVALCDPHGVEVAEDVGTGYPALEERGDVSRRHGGLSGAPRRGLSRTWSSASVLHRLTAFPPSQTHSRTFPLPPLLSRAAHIVSRFSPILKFREKSAVYLGAEQGAGRCRGKAWSGWFQRSQSESAGKQLS